LSKRARDEELPRVVSPIIKLFYQPVSLVFQGSELAYIYACLFLMVVPFICGAAGYGVIKLQDRKRRALKMKQEELKNGPSKANLAVGTVDKMAVREWLHANHKRFVKIRLGPETCLHTVDRKGEKLRTVNFKNCDTVTIEESQVRKLSFLSVF
jgi:hypothetical protein